MKKAIMISLLFLLSFSVFAKTIVIIDHASPAIKQTNRESFTYLLSDNIYEKTQMNVKLYSYDSLSNIWNDKYLLQGIVDTVNADYVLLIRYNRLGSQLTIGLKYYDIKNNTILWTDNLFLSKVKEIRYLAERIATAIKENKKPIAVQGVGMLMENEEKDILKGRKSGLMGFQMSFGYLYATVADGYGGTYNTVLEMSGGIPVELSKNSTMDISFDILIGASLAASMGYKFLATPSTHSFYFGGDLGIEYVFPRYATNVTAGGILLRPKMGMLFMNTYNVSTFIEAGYRIVFNSFSDSGFEIRFGVLFR